jgi:cell division protein FtsZ
MANARAGLFGESPAKEAAQVGEPAIPKTFIPPQPERPMSRSAPRMPTLDELPLPGQNEYRARRGEPIATEHPEKRRLTLLQRLAQVGLGRREDELDHRESAGRGPAGEPRKPDSVPEFAKRGVPHVDSRGRSSGSHAQLDDDQLDIPAFLRRQANQ